MTTPRTRFSLQGTSISLDERVHAVRGDLADLSIAGQLFVPHYARAMHKRCSATTIAVRDTGKAEGKQITELLLGEDFMVVDISGGWAWGYCRHDHYVGYVPLEALSDDDNAQQLTVTVQSASVFTSKIDNNVVDTLPLGCKVSGTRNGDFLETERGTLSLGALDGSFADPANVAETLLDTPYLWGGRSGNGIDCSGLVQQSLALASGIPAPRDSDQQLHGLGELLPADAPLRRNDIILFPGHVGIMRDEKTLLHATMHYGKTVSEPLADVIARFAAEHEQPVLARKRII